MLNLDTEAGRLARIESFRWDGSAGPWRGYPAYDDTGNRTQMTDSTGTTDYDYDALHRLASVDPPGAGSTDTIHYEYDAAGNRLHSGLKSGETWVSPYVNYYYSDGGVAGRLTHRLEEATEGATGVTLEGFPVHDANGNPTLWSHQGSPERTLTWDALDRLIAIGGVEFNASYVYGPLGRRIEKTEQGATTRYQYDGLDVVAEYDGSSALQATYLFGPGIDEPLKVSRGGVVAAYHSDGIGSILSITEIGGSAAELASYDYDAFGVLADGSGGTLTNAYTYTGRERDASGLYYYRARYYLASVGRFLTPDPMGLAGGVNPYTYVGSNPVNYRDPFGLLAFAGGSSFDNAVSPPAPPALSFSSEGINRLAGGVLDRALLDPFRSQSLREIGASALSSCHSTECSSAFGDLIAADEQRARNMLGATVAVASFLPDFAAIPGIAGSLGGRALTSTRWVPKIFTSTDPLVGQVATTIGSQYPGLVKGVNVPLYGARGNLVTDADILLENAVLQVKSGTGRRLPGQLLRTEAATDLPVIGFGPNLRAGTLRAAEKQGSLVTRDLELLLEVIKP